MVSWAKGMLPKVEARISRDQTKAPIPKATTPIATPPIQTPVVAEANLFGNLPDATASAHRPFQPSRRAKRKVSASAVSRRVIGIAGGVIAVLLFAGVGGFWFLGHRGDESKQSNQAGKTEVTFTETESASNEGSSERLIDPVPESESLAATGPVGRRAIERLFNEFDQNEDRYLDDTEVPLPEWQEMQKGDSDGDGRLSFEEFKLMPPPPRADNIGRPGPDRMRPDFRRPEPTGPRRLGSRGERFNEPGDQDPDQNQDVRDNRGPRGKGFRNGDPDLSP